MTTVVALESTNGAEGPVVCIAQRHAQRQAALLLFAKALENQHVCVNRGADGQHDARHGRQREGRFEHRHDAENDDDVEQHRDRRDDAGEIVIADEEDHHDEQADAAGNQAISEVVGAELRADREFH